MNHVTLKIAMKRPVMLTATAGRHAYRRPAKKA